MPRSDAYIKVEQLQDLIIGYINTDTLDDARYKASRLQMIDDPRVASKLPAFVRDNRDSQQIRHFFMQQFSSDVNRRQYTWANFRPLLEELEISATPADHDVSQLLHQIDPASLFVAWDRARRRREEDPAGAITAARTLLESVCKYILAEEGVAISESADITRLYKATAETLNIAPGQHAEPVFKQILGGCTAVVEGLAALRNKLGDAHGAPPKAVKPAPRHAQLAVDLAGSVATFLFATWQHRTNNSAG